MTALELADATLRASGYPGADELTERRWLDVQLPFERAHFLDGFGHPDGRFRFRADWARAGRRRGRLPPLPDYAPLTDAATDGAAAAPGGRPGAAVPELDLHGDADRPQARRPAAGADRAGGRRRARHRGR